VDINGLHKPRLVHLVRLRQATAALVAPEDSGRQRVAESTAAAIFGITST
jgi:hypothetical protein